LQKRVEEAEQKCRGSSMKCEETETGEEEELDEEQWEEAYEMKESDSEGNDSE
jgi:hypothetical protein